MGYSIEAICGSCNFKSEELLFGAGMLMHKINHRACKYPALSPDKENIVMVDIFSRSYYEEAGFTFYDSDELCDLSSKDMTRFNEWGEYKLYVARYLCPKCKVFDLMFFRGGICWD